MNFYCGKRIIKSGEWRSSERKGKDSVIMSKYCWCEIDLSSGNYQDVSSRVSVSDCRRYLLNYMEFNTPEDECKSVSEIIRTKWQIAGAFLLICGCFKLLISVLKNHQINCGQRKEMTEMGSQKSFFLLSASQIGFVITTIQSIHNIRFAPSSLRFPYSILTNDVDFITIRSHLNFLL